MFSRSKKGVKNEVKVSTVIHSQSLSYANDSVDNGAYQNNYLDNASVDNQNNHDVVGNNDTKVNNAEIIKNTEDDEDVLDQNKMHRNNLFRKEMEEMKLSYRAEALHAIQQAERKAYEQG